MLSKLKQHWKIAVIVILALIAGFFFWQDKQRKVEIREKISVIQGLNDTLKIYKDKQGRSHTESKVIEVSAPKDFAKIKGLTDENKKLQDLVKEYKKKLKEGGGVTYFETDTEVETKTITKVDTIVVDNTRKLVYSSSFDKEGWITGNVVARHDSTSVTAKVKNEFGVIVGQNKKGFLGLGTPETFADVISYNPYTETNKMRSLQVKIDKPNRLYWLGGGLVVGVIGGILLVK